MGIVVTDLILLILEMINQTMKSLDVINKWFDLVVVFSGSLVSLFVYYLFIYLF